nr:hypothetical protein BaRGS_030954 [Batillaria attramentaria]
MNTCGGSFTASTGTLQSPGYLSNYANNLDCVWTITRPEGERITLTFETLDMQGGDGCPYDSLEIRDGDSKTSPLIVKVCNTTLPTPKRSFQNFMLIRFRSDASVTGTGFRASYTSGVLKDEFFLITSSSRLIFRMDLETTSNIVIPGLNLLNPIAVDYDPVEGRMYWTDVAYKHIASAFLNGSDQKVIKNLGSAAVPDGIAVDPLSRLVFYTDSGLDVIAMMTMSGSRHRTIIDTDLDQPRAIVVDTMNGVMFWTDWGTPSKIERANYDGTERKTLHQQFLILPNAIALDMENNRLFWVDAGTDWVEYSDLDGNGRAQLYSLQGRHFFGLTYYDNQLYVTDWTSAGSNTNVSAIHRLGTDGRGGKTIGSAGVRMNDIHLYVQDGERGKSGAAKQDGLPVTVIGGAAGGAGVLIIVVVIIVVVIIVRRRGKQEYLEPARSTEGYLHAIYDPKQTDYSMKAEKDANNEWNIKSA